MRGRGRAQPCHGTRVGLSCWALEWPAWGHPIPAFPGDAGFPASAGNLHLRVGGFLLLNYFKLKRKKKKNIYTHDRQTRCSWFAGGTEGLG